MAGAKRKSATAIREMNDLQLLAHLLDLAGLELTQARSLAHALLESHGTLRQVLELPAQVLLRVPELGENAAAFLLLLPALMERYTGQGQGAHAPIVRLWESEDAAAFVLPHFPDRRVERLCVFCLGADLSLLTAAQVAQGSAMEVSLPVPRILRLALTHGAKSVVLAHNHPDGSPVFSKSDLISTGIVAQALASTGKSLSDHLLLAGGKVISLRRQCREGMHQDMSFARLPGWQPGS